MQLDSCGDPLKDVDDVELVEGKKRIWRMMMTTERVGKDESNWSFYNLWVLGDHGGKQASFQGNCKSHSRIANYLCHFPFSEMVFCLLPLCLWRVPLSEFAPELSGPFSVAHKLLCSLSGDVRINVSVLLPDSDLDLTNIFAVVVTLSIVFSGRVMGCR